VYNTPLATRAPAQPIAGALPQAVKRNAVAKSASITANRVGVEIFKITTSNSGFKLQVQGWNIAQLAPSTIA
jgi:hypothetical protein